MIRIGPNNGEIYPFAKLVDGTILHDVWIVRATGHDVRLFVTDGGITAPMDNVVFFGNVIP